MKVFNSIMVGLAIFIAMMVADWMFKSSEEEEGRIGIDNLVLSAVCGVLIGLINYFVPTFYVGTPLGFMPPILLVVMVGYIVYLMYWWYADGSDFYELIPFLVIVAVAFFTTKATAVMTAGMVSDPFWYSVILVIPEIVLIIAIGFFLINLCLFRYNEMGENEMDRILAIIAGVLAAIALIFILVNKVNWRSINMARMEEPGYAEGAEYVEQDSAEKAESTATVEASSEYGFYNLNLQNDGDARNDFNFGPNPYTEGATAKTYDADLRYRMSKDPALAAADMAWLDANVGTRYLGEFYESCKGDWAKTINLTKERFIADPSLRFQTLNAFFAFLDTADGVSLEYQTSDLTDQMYMNPHTVNSVPDVVVMTTTEQSGYFLTYTFIIKGNVFRVSYRIDCGYQPTNVQKIMNIKPDDTPRQNVSQPTPQPQTDPTPTPAPTPTPTPTPETEPKPTPTPTPETEPKPTPTPTPETEPKPTPTPTPETEPKPTPETEPKPTPTPETEPKPTPETEPKPTPTPETEPTPQTEAPKKDPTKSPSVNTEPNDDPGPGPNTNNGVGSTTAPADQPTNSNHITVEEYHEVVEDLNTINQEQKTGDEPSTPSTPPNVVTESAPSAVNVDNNVDAKPSTPPVAIDNNGDSGSVVEDVDTGEPVKVEPINEPTPVAAPAIVADTGEAISDNPGEAWGGPPD